MGLATGDKIRIGFIGVGNIAQNAIMPAYLKQPDVEIVAVCDLKEARAREVAERHGIPHVYTDFNEMVKRDDIDAISVCTWNNSHAPATIAALQAGKHVLCEKPPAMTVAEAEEMRDAAKDAGKVLMYGLVQRFRTEVTVLKEFMEAGKFGDIYFGKTSILRRRGTPLGWFTDPAKSGGGPVIDIGVHLIDVTRYLMGSPQPTRVSAQVWSPTATTRPRASPRWKRLRHRRSRLRRRGYCRRRDPLRQRRGHDLRRQLGGEREGDPLLQPSGRYEGRCQRRSLRDLQRGAGLPHRRPARGREEERVRGRGPSLPRLHQDGCHADPECRRGRCHPEDPSTAFTSRLAWAARSSCKRRVREDVGSACRTVGASCVPGMSAEPEG